MTDITTHQKGAIGEHKVVADLICKGYEVHKPLQDSMPYDLLVNIKGYFHTIQVKYVSVFNGYIETSPRRARSSKKTRERNKEYDLLAIYCPETDLCYYVWDTDFNQSIRLRIDPPKNNQKADVRFAQDYLEI